MKVIGEIIIGVIIGAALCLGVLQLIHYHNETVTINKMKEVCERSYNFHDGQLSDRGLEEQCGELIDKVHGMGFEVSETNGHWSVP